MKNILRNRMALSTVVTTLIILVVSVLLAGVVTYFAINVTSTRVQEESLTLQKLHVWVPQDSTKDAVAAFLIINTGGRDVVINKITVRGQATTFTGATGDHAVCSKVTNLAVTNDLAYIAAGADCAGLIAANAVTIAAGTTLTLSAATGAITLTSGNSLVVYIDNPDSITLNDIGLTVGVTVFTSQAMYYQEANVESIY